MENSHASSSDRLLPGKVVIDRIGCGMSKFYKMLKAGEFPPGVRIGTQGVRWRESAVNQWIESRPIAEPRKSPRSRDAEAAA
ncbi:AlpA family transcriptional regulator [Hyphomicrobium sp. MC1]|uniref:helix-turn-helix transcriptional regulator n=1 Tax=Hyphomicrobium sp. (strain MC1) TaxID=717785 RepID=UPI000213E3E0|nr:AlpA family phage regulatory protein [Hyphomicrobium sp. MC1]CCB65246.1 putative Phage transcriptional regulator, AlpA [Hyphomicrobium sp. MC1]